LFRRGEVTIGMVYLVFVYTETLARPIQAINRQVQDFQTAAAAVGRVSDLLATRSRVVDGPGDAIPQTPPGVELTGVGFHYIDGEPVLDDVSIRLEPGHVLGLLGRTGSGKTTITRLLLRFYDPESGSVRVGDVDLRRLRTADLRRHVGLVTQDVHLFHASVRDNVTFFDPAVPDERIAGVLRELGLGEWLDRLPRGLDTPIAPGGAGLSSGEAQLLAFARVFLREPGLVVLDEATSRLDPATERRVEHAIDELLRGRTAIVVAHRLRTVLRADDILIVSDGRVLEYGSRLSLVADPDSQFSRLLRTGLEDVLA
jgi:ATP-binding cassette subfamily B protein